MKSSHLGQERATASTAKSFQHTLQHRVIARNTCHERGDRANLPTSEISSSNTCVKCEKSEKRSGSGELHMGGDV